MMIARWVSALALALLAMGQPAALAAESFITLGTHGGPIPSLARSQPANALVVEGAVYLVDAGDGAAGQLAKAGYSPRSIRAVFISHLHFDHTGGLFAILGLRYQTNAPGTLTVYGPPGTRETVASLLAAMVPAAQAGYGLPGADVVPPDDRVEVVEIRDGSQLEMEGFTVTAAENTHYSFPEGGDMDTRFDSLSFRFDLPTRSIVYTGDTGPSEALTELAQGADLLVTEMIDVERTVSAVKRNSPNMPPRLLAELTEHLSMHHLTADEVGLLAARADVGRIVITHFVAGQSDGAPIGPYLATIGRHYDGPVVISSDLSRF